ncbi:protein FAR1-RELATED SEQUENCE 5-like [Arachis stenosperma]|uniref:protein FAR1-RELATED SEQUENCE 5-like n=1 Tax=Arachis stenosperma TaxID=217475 RepID=UPI0025ABF0B4|nr:protein FAR1-RELATED SEQUENCE 5-like [Arachis stenosperma]
MNKIFRSDEAAYEFYRRFGKCFGFGIRKGDSGKDESGRVIRRRFFCNRAGLRQRHYDRLDRNRGHRLKTCTNCEAKLSVYLDVVSGKWRAHGVPTSKILGYMAGQAGGYSLMGFTKKDAYNYINKAKRAKIIDGDANATVVYLEGKAGGDPMSMARYNLTKDNMLANMFWADGGSRVDYQNFRDVLAFDSTYKKNKYQRPLVIFSGVNNHKQTTIFGFGLVLDESVGSYKWLLENLLEVMCNKKPSVVVTDDCDSMKAAINSFFPEATHRLCAWHMEKNVTANVKEKRLRQCFTRWLYSEMEIDEFEAEWDDAVEEYGLQNSFWAKETFQKRMMWANAYLQDKFCAGFRTTSWCEDINAYVKNFLKSRHSLVDMVQNLELVVREYRNNELLAQFRSLHGMPVMTTCLDPLEKYAADAYTREIFVDAKKEIVGVSAVNFVAKNRHSTTMVYTLEEYGNPGIERWRKEAKSLDKYAEIAEVGSERGFLLCHGALHAAAQWMLYVGARSPSSFTQALNGLHTLCQELDRGHENVRQNKAHDTVEMHDPAVVKTKGAPRVRRQGGRKRRCTRCRKTSHLKRHCNSDGAFVSKAKDNKDFEAINLGSEGSSPTEGVCSESSGSKIRLQDEIPAASGRSETMECERNVINNTDDLLKQLLTQITDISSRLGSRFPT